MADIAKASLLLVPRIDNLSGSINKSIGAATNSVQKTGESVGSAASKGMGKGLVTGSAVFGVVSTIASKAFDQISSSMGSAISRFDTLNRFPKTMQLLGYSAKDSEASISKMSDRLQKLPTRLDDMASLVQGLVTSTHDLGKATDAGLALNDMLIASGSSQQLASAAMEQFRQILSKGKPEMQDWKSLTQAMPGQMDQLAKAMLGPTANANDLYAALGGGKHEATISMDDLLNAMITLDNEGGDHITSFKDQAEAAAGGVQTSMDNTFNAITKGLAGTLEAIGTSNISGMFGSTKDAINNFFKVFNNGLKDVLPKIKNFIDAIAPFAPVVGGLVASFVGWQSILAALPAVLTPIKIGIGEIGAALTLLKEGASIGSVLSAAFATINIPLLALTAGLAVLTTIIGIGIAQAQEAAKKQENFAKATEGLNDAVSKSTNLDMYSTSMAGIGTSAGNSALSVDDLTQKIADNVDQMNEIADKAQTQITTLTTAQAIIDQYAGQTDLSTEAQGRLKWAIKQVNDEFGLNITAMDVANGYYEDQDGNIIQLRDSIDTLIAKKKEEIKVNALTEQLTTAYQNQADAAATLAGAQQSYNNKLSELGDKQTFIAERTKRYGAEAAKAMWDAEVAQARMDSGLDKAQATYDSATQAVKDLNTELGNSMAVAEGTADAYTVLSQNLNPLFGAQLKEHGQNLNDFTEDLRALGVDTEAFSQLGQEELTTLASHYNGTTQSIVRDLKGWNIGMDETAAANAETLESMKDAFGEVGGAVRNAFAEHGADIDAFVAQLANAGITTEQLNAIGSENLGILAQNCGYDMNYMQWAITNYNNVPVIDKDGTVHINESQLVDAQGNIAVWNNNRLEYLDGKAVADDTKLTDAQGHVYTWNDTELKSWDADATINSNTAQEQGLKVTWNQTGFNSYQAYVDIHKTIHERTVTENAAGGIRLHADGGIFPRYHARGAIATRAVPLDIVGEAGAEAIVPLTNKHYSQPFVDLISNGVNARLTSSNSSVVAELRALRSELPRWFEQYRTVINLAESKGLSVDGLRSALSAL